MEINATVLPLLPMALPFRPSLQTSLELALLMLLEMATRVVEEITLFYCFKARSMG